MRPRMTATRLLLGAVGLALALPAAALARGPRGACAQDVAALCPQATTRQEIRQCLAEHENDLSDACLAARQEARDLRIAVRDACQADVQALCPDAQTPRAFRRCLYEHRDQLSDPCQQILDTVRSHWRRH